MSWGSEAGNYRGDSVYIIPWCEKFLQQIQDSTKPMTPSYNDRAKQLADFIEQFAKEIGDDAKS